MREFEKQVHYNTSGWLDKNKDPINECVVTLMQESKEPLVSSFFKEPEEGAIFYLSEFWVAVIGVDPESPPPPLFGLGPVMGFVQSR